MSLADVCWNISSVFIVITLGVIAILCVLMLLGVFVCIFDHDDNHRNDKNSKGITMATNVTEKDKTLHEVIDFLQKEWDAANNVSDNPDEEVYDFYDGMTTAYEHVINYCRHLLGYSGSMPSEVPNQSEDAKK